MDPPWVLDVILDFRNYQKTAKLTFLDDKDVEHDITKSTFCAFVTYKGEKIHIFA